MNREYFFNFVKIKKKGKFDEFTKDLQFLIFVAEIPNKHFCKLDKNRRSFPSWQFFVFVKISRYLDLKLAILSNGVPIF